MNRATEEAPEPPPKLMRKISNIPEPHYGAWHEGRFYDFNPTHADIQHAINENSLEPRNYQLDVKQLDDEWVHGCNGNIDEYCRLQKKYHAARIAYFVVNDWTDPIVVSAEGKMIDGTHRLKAAKHQKRNEVEIRIAQ